MVAALFVVQTIIHSLLVVILVSGIAYIFALFLLKEPSIVEIRAIFK
jgi:hypothetical protein